MPPLLPLVRPQWRLKPRVDDEPDHRPPIFINRPTTTEPTTEVPTVPTTTEPTSEVPTVPTITEPTTEVPTVPDDDLDYAPRPTAHERVFGRPPISLPDKNTEVTKNTGLTMPAGTKCGGCPKCTVPTTTVETVVTVEEDQDSNPQVWDEKYKVPTTTVVTVPTTTVPTVPTTTEPTMEVPTVADASADARSARKRGRSPTEEMSPRSKRILYGPNRIKINDVRYEGKTHLMPLRDDYGGGFFYD